MVVDRSDWETSYAVVVADEIAKAHRIFSISILQVMDHGLSRTTTGLKADFRNVIIIMTDNAGAESLTRTSCGFTQDKNRRRNG